MSIDIIKWIRGMHLERVFTKLSPELQNAVHIGVTVVENIKNIIASPVADIITALIPGDADDLIKQRLREWLPKIFIELKLAENCTKLVDPNVIVKCAINTLQEIEGNFRSVFLHDLAILITQVAADGKINFADVVHLTEWYYQHKYKK